MRLVYKRFQYDSCEFDFRICMLYPEVSSMAKAVTREMFWVLKYPPEIISSLLISQLCLFVQQNVYGNKYQTV